MPTAEFKAAGDRVDYTPAAAVDAGQVVVLNNRMCVVAVNDIAADDLGAAYAEGIFKLPKESVAFVPGDDVFWDQDAEVATAAEGAYFGKAVPIPGSGDPDSAAAAADDYVYAKLLAGLEADYATTTGTGTPPE